ncbi:fructosamine kinase family protein [Mucilaginibacter pallidiroseus]|uniref:Fructosamine kinase family protein n=1 Tax=Mucilaginibacter pallidiroseus TaxID=2599295 RepID=A0A563UJ05_9SPHI|nr:fructosamine kinase family protein [Mucilaginibacter pallidiroseus]TWR31347.1 fructosamine kinase family protein [Mucilaginibacter pallidiroseus]
MLNPAVKAHISSKISVNIQAATPVSGGDINAAFKLETDRGPYFLKLNNSSKFPEMFLREQEGLNAIIATNEIKAPRVVLQDEADGLTFLLLEWIERSKATPAALAKLGAQLAAFHKHNNGEFGWRNNNFVGSLVQINKNESTWSTFFINQRLQPLVKNAFDNGLLGKLDIRNFELLYKQLNNLFGEEKPSIVHGDLWGGNYLLDINEDPWLIDPAIYYGHREMDIALTQLFGGFGNDFCLSYNEVNPLLPGWQQRVDLWNLYPLLVHLNLFGASYAGQLRHNLSQYI